MAAAPSSPVVDAAADRWARGRIAANLILYDVNLDDAAVLAASIGDDSLAYFLDMAISQASLFGLLGGRGQMKVKWKYGGAYQEIG